MSVLLLDDDVRKPASGLDAWPRAGMSISGLVVNPRHNLAEIMRIYNGCGVTLTRINLLALSWHNPNNLMPFTRMPDGRWDLFKWDPRFFDRLAEVQDRANEAGIVCQWTNYGLNWWSSRKSSPEQASTPWRNNINGVHWSPEDTTLYRLPDLWSIAWFEKVVKYLHLRPNVFEIGNEFPEKPLHERVAREIRRIQPDALISVNRNEDTPGQWANMGMGRGTYDFLAHHGRFLKDVDDLDTPYPQSKSQMLPTATFRELLDAEQVDNRKLIFSSDGARVSDDPVNTYNSDKLKEFFREVHHKYHCSIEHQSRAKMTEEPNHHMIETDWFRSVIA